jgi:Mn-dependent DtxR family transcriptional regulator
MTKSKDAFTEWFEEQFGGLPMTEDEYDSAVIEHGMAMRTANRIDQKLQRSKTLEVAWKAALYAKNAQVAGAFGPKKKTAKKKR